MVISDNITEIQQQSHMAWFLGVAKVATKTKMPQTKNKKFTRFRERRRRCM